MSTKTDELKKAIEDNFHRMVFYESINHFVKLPTFDLYPRDYLGYAENGITNGDTKKLIECVGNLKRAMDCQIDVFLNAFGLGKYFKKLKLGVDKKLDFFRLAGIFDSRTLTRLNTIRNRMEHRYEIPKIQDVEIYFDLVSAFVSILESTILLLRYEDLVFTNTKNVRGKRVEMGEGDEYLSISYDFEKSHISIDYDNLPDRTKKQNQLRQVTKEDGFNYNEWYSDSGGLCMSWSATPSSDYDDFVYCFRIFYLLAQKEAFSSDEYILARL